VLSLGAACGPPARLSYPEIPMHTNTDDVRIEGLRPLLPPAILMEELPLRDTDAERIAGARREIGEIIQGRDPRLLVIVGPCSIHDPSAALDYAARLLEASKQLSSELKIVMRTYFEKPRTTVGWKGLINDPKLDGSFAINQGLRVARKLLLDVVELGLPTGTEFLDPISPQFVADLVAWGAIGARTTESQVHRELASGLSMPVGFKNGTGGSIQIAVDAIRSAAHPHHFLSVTKQGLAAIVTTKGNQDCHLILRGGTNGPNYDAAHVEGAVSALTNNGVSRGVMVDASHANSGKSHDKQREVVQYLSEQIGAGDRRITGIMIESFLVAGRQEHSPGKALTYGQSITDACIGWTDTLPLLESLAQAAAKRRARGA
jgi:3-deoxy-7-phosphoheptulonate synthase